MLSNKQKQQLHKLARDSIIHGLDKQSPVQINVLDFDEPLTKPGASFVTLKRNHQLRGCIGTLEAHRPLANDVAHNAWAAAFQDPRFMPLQANETDDLEIHISILEAPENMAFSSEQDLLSQIKPGIDGLVLEDFNHRATFLPAVWESLPDKKSFIQQLKLKAGLPANYWSDSIQFQRYSVEEF